MVTSSLLWFSVMQVFFCAQSVAEAVIPEPGWAMISIVDSGCPPAQLEPGWSRLLRLHFDDITVAPPPGFGDRFVPFAWGDAARVVLFVSQLVRRPPPRVVVHCWAGVSRSGAVAAYVARRLACPVTPLPEDPNRWVLARLAVVHRLLSPLIALRIL